MSFSNSFTLGFITGTIILVYRKFGGAITSTAMSINKISKSVSKINSVNKNGRNKP